ncbi:hypothetical protein AcV5_007333 [Taiwanofungus camphoratus]|nr:hypothetical protein AcV5_007333 [Antrodia cinnamomea]
MDNTFSLSNDSKSGSQVPAAGSASIQSRPSATGSQPRLRTLSHGLDTSKTSKRLLADDFVCDSSCRTSYLSRLLCMCLPAELQPMRQCLARNSLLRWFILFYCICSSALLSVTLYVKLYGPNFGVSFSEKTDGEMSPLESLSMTHLLSKVTSIYPQPRVLDAYILKAFVEPTAVTACLWATDQDVDFISVWAARWTGPISLLMTTVATPSSEEHEMLLRKLSALQARSPLLNSTLSVHLLHLAPNTPDNPNAFLNLARLFSPTSQVVLFPGNLSMIPPKALYRTLLPHSSTSSAAIVEPPNAHTANRHRPTILTTRDRTSFPFSPLAPVVLGRDDPLWCTERFFPPFSRAADWEECLWQVWLEYFGDVEVRQTRGWLHDGLSTSFPSGPDFAVKAKLRRRLVTKYRSETCILATRQLAALRSMDKALDAKKARWLKRVCREWTNAA